MKQCTKLKPPRPAFTMKNPNAELYLGDATEIMPQLSNSGLFRSVDLIFADPPFNQNDDYGDEFTDKMSPEAYRGWTRTWIREAALLLRLGGSMFVHVPDHIVSCCYETMRGCGLTAINWIILHQEFGQYGEGRFIKSKQHLLYFVRPGGERTWNVKEVLEPSLRLKTGDPRTATAKFKGMRPMLDCWMGPNLGRVQGNNAERWKNHPNQLPEMYLARIIRCASNPGDLVFDPFHGTGTTTVVARALGRRAKACELSKSLATSSWNRVKKGAVRDVAGILYNGGV